MVIRLNRSVLLGILVLVMAALVIVPGLASAGAQETVFLGGTLEDARHGEAGDGALKADAVQEQSTTERFQRPSQKEPLPNPYSYNQFEDNSHPPVMKTPEDPVLAYYGLLEEAANMLGYSGGCGSIGLGTGPYPYAYTLLTPQAQERMSEQEFEQSFRGVGHITLLQMHPLPPPAGAPEEERYYMIEIEVITGPQAKTDRDYIAQSYFAYYDGVATVRRQDGAWAIENIEYYTEDFLCAPYHGWQYDAEAVVGIVYQDNMHLIDRITGQEVVDGVRRITAVGPSGTYRFDFVRLTNGYDTLIGEYRLENGQWTPVQLLTDGWQNLKLTPQKPGGTKHL